MTCLEVVAAILGRSQPTGLSRRLHKPLRPFRMSTRRRTFLMYIAISLSIPCVSRAGVANPAEQIVIEMVEQAAEAISAHGVRKAYRITPKSVWSRANGAFYVYVFDRNGIMHHHPQNLMVGRSIATTRDVRGNMFIARILKSLVPPRETVWTEYMWRDPADGRIRIKRAYSKRVGDLIVTCGYYLDEA